MVSERDREHFRKLGRWNEELRAEDLSAHLALPGTERLVAAFRLMLAGAYFSPQHGRPDDDRPEELYDRARRLGLYRP
jgi:hypothetical protein